jgi:hypothetical protein
MSRCRHLQKKKNSLIATYSELSGWVTAFSFYMSFYPFEIYTKNKFDFRIVDKAIEFENNIRESIRTGEEKRMAGNYYWNFGEKLNVMREGRSVIITWGLR